MTTDYTVYYGIEHLNRVYNSASIAFDTETLQLQPDKGKLRLLQLGCFSTKAIVIIDCFELEDDDWDKLNLFFTNGDRFWLAHNAVFDLAWLQEYGIYPRGRVRCSMIASRLLTNGIFQVQHTLAAVAKRQLDIDVSKEQQLSDWSATELSKEQLDYAAKDVEVLLELDQILDKKLLAAGLHIANELECKALPAMAQMWRTGLPWNKEELEKIRVDYADTAKEMSMEFVRELDNSLPEDEKLPREEGLINLRAKDTGAVRLGTKKYAGFNMNSPKQLVNKLTHVLGFIPVDENGKASASRQTLRGYASDHTVIQTYLGWKKQEKRRQMVTSIQEKMADDGFVRASYRQLGADTGRMSCVKPNNQQIPRDKQFRACVQAPEGWTIVDADFSQMELRLAAAVAQDASMITAFQKGIDLHDYTASKIFNKPEEAVTKEEREIAKSANFGLLYGQGNKGLRRYAGGRGVLMSLDQATKVREAWFKVFPDIKMWQDANNEKAEETEEDVWPEIRVPHSQMRRFLKGDLNRLTVRCNTPIQGAGAAILKCALGKLWPKVKEAGEDTVLIAAAVHDEILLLAKDDVADHWASILKQVMEEAEARWLGDIPALAEVATGKTWEEAH